MYFDKFGVNFGNIKLKITIGAQVLHYHTSRALLYLKICPTGDS